MDFSYTGLRWTSRNDVCNRIAWWLRTVPRSHAVGECYCQHSEVPPREVAGELMLLLAGLTQESHLRDLVLRSNAEDPWLVYLAWETLARIGHSLAAHEVGPLLTAAGEQAWRVFQLCHSPAAVDAAWQALVSWPAGKRNEVLSRLAEPDSLTYGWPKDHWPRTPPRDLLDRLYRDWAETDWRLARGADSEDSAAASDGTSLLAMCDQPEVLRVLSYALGNAERFSELAPAALWRHPERLQHLLVAADLTLAELPMGAILSQAASGDDASYWLTQALARHYGVDELLLHVEAALRSEGNARQRHAWWSTPDRWGAVLLESLPGEQVDDLVISLLSCPDLEESLNPGLRRALWERLWRFSRESIAEQVRQFTPTGQLDDEQIRDALSRCALAPQTSDRELLLWSTTAEQDPEYAFAGLLGLEALGEDGADWRRTLERLADSSVNSVRLLASAALVRRGDSARLAEIERCARTFPASAQDREGDHQQGLALRLLGELDGARYAGLMQAVLAQHFPWEHNGSPDQEAAYALAQLATPEAVTTLLQAYLAGSDYLRRLLRTYVPAAVARLEGEDAPLTNQVSIWRYARFPP